MSFEKKLQSLRKAAGLNQEELAEELGVSRQAVSNGNQEQHIQKWIN